MKYDWEKMVKARMRYMQDILPDHLQIVGVAVENVDMGQGALVQANSFVERGDVVEADVRQDILGDAQRQYDYVRAVVFPDKPEVAQ